MVKQRAHDCCSVAGFVRMDILLSTEYEAWKFWVGLTDVSIIFATAGATVLLLHAYGL